MTRCHTHGPAASATLAPEVLASGEIWGGAPASHWGLGFRLNGGDRKFGTSAAAGSRVFGHHGGAGAFVAADPVTGASWSMLTTEPTMCYSAEFNAFSDLVLAALASL